MDRLELLSLLLKTEKHFGITATLYIFYGTNIHMKIAYSHKTCETSIDEMQLSVRAWNALKRSGVNTIGELIDVIQGDGLMKIRNLGRKSMVEMDVRTLSEILGHTKVALTLQLYAHSSMETKQKEVAKMDAFL